MCFPNAKEVKANQNAKLWISCKAFVNTPMQKLVYFGLMNYLTSHLEAILGFEKSETKVIEVSGYILECTGLQQNMMWSILDRMGNKLSLDDQQR